MKVEDYWFSQLLDGSLETNHANAFVTCLRNEPALEHRLVEELVLSDLISRECDSARTDAAFLIGFQQLLDGGLGWDGFDYTGGADAPMQDAGVSQNGVDTYPAEPTSPELLPTPKAPSPVFNTAPLKAFVLIAIVVAAMIGGTLLLTEDPIGQEIPSNLAMPAPPPVPPPLPVAPEPVIFNVLADADASIHSTEKRKMKFGKEPYLHVHTNTRGYSCGTLIRFDLANIPKDAGSAILYFTPLEIDDKMAAVSIRIVPNNDWVESTVTHAKAPAASGRVLATWQPKPDVPNAVDLTELLRSRWPANGILSLRIDVPGQHKTYRHAIYASSEHEDPEKRPVLRIKTKPVDPKP